MNVLGCYEDEEKAKEFIKRFPFVYYYKEKVPIKDTLPTEGRKV